ncbi:sugar phosphate isomerase/epimerase [Paraburkholderia sp. Ac-20336]|uniref:sugar phosphate isomerase/epimerase family protein n=1 Tax=Paraburkholderia sp. Ac-20336 TaxID=2703886 RepID=UPI00197FB507|nr:sugar phosphate isomerase/epimerase family protein [Paraburkholderia sp. Ac-20336]MBN3804797.1 sugar phosphate isomerase/epimerase [Paraburkholderia sp. Ac-20336]
MTPGVFARTYAAKYPGDLFARIRADGFSAAQFNLSCAGFAALPDAFPSGMGERIAQSAREAGLTLCALSGTYNMAYPDPAQRQRDRAGFENVMRAAREMGVSLVTLCTGSRDTSNMWRAHPDNRSDEAWHTLRGELDFALALAEAFDLVLGIEPEPGNVIADARLARRILDEMGSTRLGIVLDAANLLPPEAQPRQNEIVAEAAELLGGSLFLVHAKDIDRHGTVVPAGQGAVDLPAFVARMKAVGYDGPLVGHNFEESDAPGVASYLSSIIQDCAR